MGAHNSIHSQRGASMTQQEILTRGSAPGVDGRPQFAVTVLQEGTIMIDVAQVFGQVPRSEWEQILKPNRQNRVPLGLNCVLVQAYGKNILIGTGAGSKRLVQLKGPYGLNGNKLPKRMNHMGISAKDIDFVILQHGHQWHAGGCTKIDRQGEPIPMFPRARHIIQADAWQYAQNPAPRHRDLFRFEDDLLPLDQKGLVDLVDGDDEIIIPGISVRVTEGSFKGHQLVFLRIGPQRIVVTGDLMPTWYNIASLCVSPLHDSIERAEAAKRALLAQIADTPWMVVFSYAHQKHGAIAAHVRQPKGGEYQVETARIDSVL